MVDVRVSLRDVLLSACLVTSLAGTAHADDDKEVVTRLTRHSDLSSSAAKKLVSKVNVRMAKAADATSSGADPMRAAVSLALFQAPQPPNSMGAAKVRLRLYAGLNEWALEAIFAPQPGVIAGCVREVGATTSECEALVAAAGKQSVAQVRSIAGGSAPAAVAGGNFGGGQPAAAGGSRFGRFGSGYQGAQQYSPPQQQYGRPQQYAAPQQQYGRPMAPAYQAPAPAPVSPQEAAARKDAYKAQREAYIARQKALFEDRKAKVAAVHQADASEAPPRPGEGRDAVYEGAAPASAKPASAPAKASSKPAASDSLDEAPAEAVAAKGGGKPALDNDFLDGLLDDPLANKGKK